MSLIESLNDIVMGLRFFMDLPFYMRRRMNPAQAKKAIQERIANREQLFLDTCKRVVKGGGPYARLFDLAGCTIEDVEHLVDKEGLEGALQAIYKQGVYLTGDEFKGLRPVVRGSASFMVRPEQLRNPEAAYHFPALTGRSRGQGTPVPLGLDHTWEYVMNVLTSLAAHGPHEWVQANWQLPGSSVLAWVTMMTMMDLPPKRWFSQVNSHTTGLHRRYAWSERTLKLGSAFAGVKIPSPQFVPMNDLSPIAEWVSSILRSGKTPHICTTVSSAVRLCLFAMDTGTDLTGAFFTVRGEAVTPARMAVLDKAGVRFIAHYSSMDAGLMGLACHNPTASDDMHVVSSCVALIQVGASGIDAGLPPKALLVTRLTQKHPFDLINFSTGDQADLEYYNCSCPLEETGWHQHMKNIRSFEKLTGGGITFSDHQLIRILEEILPQRFGGAPTDYQLVEDEDSTGLPLMRLMARPSLGEMNPAEVERVFLNALSHGGGAQKVAAEQWRNGQVLKLERKNPIMTPAGKILHLHQAKSQR